MRFFEEARGIWSRFSEATGSAAWAAPASSRASARAAGLIVLCGWVTGAAAEPPARRRLDAVHVAAVHHLHFEPDSLASGVAVALETGAFLHRDVGVTAMVRGQVYSDQGDFVSPLRHELFVGGRVYFEPVRGRILAGLGAGFLLARRDDPTSYPVIDYATQKFVEVYVGWTALRTRCTDLELGGYAGYSPDEQYVWAGLALGVRRRIW